MINLLSLIPILKDHGGGVQEKKRGKRKRTLISARLLSKLNLQLHASTITNTYTLTGNISLSAAMELETYTVTLIPYSRQQGIKFVCDGVTTTANGAQTTTTAKYGKKWTATAVKSSIGATWDNYGKLSASSGTITGDLTIKGTSAPYDYCDTCNSGCGAEGCGGEGAQ